MLKNVSNTCLLFSSPSESKILVKKFPCYLDPYSYILLIYTKC